MTTNKPEVVAYATHHDEPMLFPSKREAAMYCDAGEEPLALIRLSDYEALQAECEKLRQQVETFQGLKPAMPPMPPNGKGLPRYGVRWNGPTQPLSVPKDDGYWTPWHLAQTECEKLRRDVSALVEALTELCDKHDTHAAISKTSISWFKRKARKALAAYRKGR